MSATASAKFWLHNGEHVLSQNTGRRAGCCCEKLPAGNHKSKRGLLCPAQLPQLPLLAGGCSWAPAPPTGSGISNTSVWPGRSNTIPFLYICLPNIGPFQQNVWPHWFPHPSHLSHRIFKPAVSAVTLWGKHPHFPQPQLILMLGASRGITLQQWLQGRWELLQASLIAFCHLPHFFSNQSMILLSQEQSHCAKPEQWKDTSPPCYNMA